MVNRILVTRDYPMAPSRETLERYLPGNYKVVGEDAKHFIVEGEDDHGWTAEGYVIPRLASGLIWGKLENPSSPGE